VTRFLTVLGVLGVFVAPFAVTWLAVTALVEVARLATGKVERTREAVLCLLVRMVVVVSIPVLAVVFADVAERRNGWVDVDGNGMLDPMINGSYDWFDINGGDWVRMWGTATFVIVGGSTWVLSRCGQTGSVGAVADLQA
jgi:hypothetical protein